MAGPEQSDVQRALTALGASMLPYRSFAEPRDALSGVLGAVEENAATAAAFPLLAAALPGVVVPDAGENPRLASAEPVAVSPPRAEVSWDWRGSPKPGVSASPATRSEEANSLPAPAREAAPTAAPPPAGTRSLSDMFRILRGHFGGGAGRSGFLSGS